MGGANFDPKDNTFKWTEKALMEILEEITYW